MLAVPVRGAGRPRQSLQVGVLVAVVLAGLLAAGCRAEEDRAGSFEDELLIVPREGWRTDFSRHAVPLIEFRRGGPGKDGIPAIDRPRFVAAAEAAWLDPEEPVIELVLDGEARAYPLEILVWHEIVNDELAGRPVAVTFCPLCHTALAFERRLDERTLAFGVSGLLRHSDLVMYDRQTESWWQQFSGEAVVGELAGATLPRLPAAIVAWQDFLARHPDALVLSRDTGYERPYGGNPYPGYDDAESPTFLGTPNQDDGRVPLKERVVFVEIGGDALAVPFSALERAKSVRVEVGGEHLEIIWRPGVRSVFGAPDRAEPKEVGSALVQSASGKRVTYDTPFWFAVAAFRPDTKVWTQTGLLDAAHAPRRPVPPATPHDSVNAAGRLAG